MNEYGLAPGEECSSDPVLAARITELESANQMLEDFAALVSHDMRGALRRVLSFSELLRVLPVIEADTHTTSFLRTIIGSARKIQHLVDEVLTSQERFRAQNEDLAGGNEAALAAAEARAGADPRKVILELRARHTELAAEAYLVAQALRNPLMQILSVSGMLQRLPLIVANPVCRDMAAHILAGGKQMQQLIDDYLSFMQLERDDLKPRRVSILLLVQLARHDLEPQAAGRQVIWQIDPLPEVEGDARMLGQAIFNLLNNALKYTRRRLEARIEVGAQAGTREWIFHIRDNGIGFDDQAGGSLFQKFGRLHSEPGFEGAGIGLVVVQHIIRRHGGRVWAEGIPGEGACFYFTLPK